MDHKQWNRLKYLHEWNEKVTGSRTRMPLKVQQEYVDLKFKALYDPDNEGEPTDDQEPSTVSLTDARATARQSRAKPN